MASMNFHTLRRFAEVATMLSFTAVVSLALLLAAPATAAQQSPAEPEKKADASAADESKPVEGAADAAASEQPDDEPVAPSTPEEFDAALRAHYSNDPRVAAPAFYAWLRGSARTADNYEWAQFFLAENLAKLGFSHAAAVYYGQVIRNRSRPELLPHALLALEKLMAAGPYDPELVEREILAGTDFGLVPAEASAFVHFYKGLVAHRNGQQRWADAHFDRLKPGSAYAARARLIRAADALKAGKTPEAPLQEFLALIEDEAAPREVKNEARISAARLKYEMGEYDAAQELYDSVELPPLDPGRAQIYLEKAWTHYHRGEVSDAMGLLLALDAPSFREVYLPEKFLLRALLFKDHCHYLPAKRAAREFTRRYRSSLQLIRERGRLEEDPKLLRAAYEQNARASAAQAFLERLKEERDALGAWAGRFQASGLLAQLHTIYGRAIAEAIRQREALLRQALLATADDLLRYEEQVRLLDYEVGLDLYKRLRKGQAKAAAEQRPFVNEDEVAFTFDGEYWNDELRDYRFELESRCGAVEAER